MTIQYNEYTWPEREDAKGNAPGYHAFWRKGSKRSEPHDWEVFLDLVSVQFGDDGLKAAIKKATEEGVNKELKTTPALFEYALIHRDRPKKRVKVYLGKTMNFQKSQDALLQETGELAKFFRLALQHNCSVYRRYVYYAAHDLGDGRNRKIDPECLVERAQSRFLSYYDYPWNPQKGSTGERGIYLVPHSELCCIPSGVDVIRIHPSMMT